MRNFLSCIIILLSISVNTNFAVAQEKETTVQDETTPAPSNVLPDKLEVTNERTVSTDKTTDITDDEEIEITVTGTRTPRQIRDAPGGVTVIKKEEIDRNQVRNLRDLIRYEPGTSVGNSPRYGFQNFNIRGIEGNRVLFQIDSVRLPNQFDLPPFGTGRDFVDLSTLNTVEILKSPASTLYGSDALGGVVTFTTIEPKDLLDAIGKDTYVGISSGFSSTNNGFSNTVTFAARQDNLEAALIYTRRDFEELQRNGNRAFSDPQTGRSNNYFGKLVYRFDNFNTLKFTAEVLNRSVDTNFAPANLIEETGGSRTVRDLFSGFATNRTRLSLNYEFANPNSDLFVQLARLQLYYQNTETPETTIENRLVAPAGTPPNSPATQLANRFGQNNFRDRILGGNVQLESNFRTGEVGHKLTYGLDISTQNNERPRDKIQTNLVTGAQTRRTIPDTFPTKDFPDSNTFRLGVYVQDEISFGDGSLSLIPGIRYDAYSLRTSADADFFRNGSPAPANFDASAISPRLALVWKVAPETSIFAQYARGFRAPLYDEINSGFANTVFGYRVVPNPDLKAETSDGFELGVRGTFPQGRYSLIGFYNLYNNFIQPFVNTGEEFVPGFPRPFIRFQTQNIANARIYGIEASGEYRFSPAEDGFSLVASLGFTVGDDTRANQPLPTIPPFKAVVGLRYRAPENQWGGDLIATLVGTPRVPSDTIFFVPNGYTTVDLIGFYNFTKDLTLNLGIFNLFNAKYFDYADLRTFPAVDSARIDRLAQPGTNVSVTLNYRF
jgi:hemoglobin/transferrin/lactoferrin receptor protein